MKVKICGIKRKEDALKAISYGADAIGLLVGQKHPSHDFITKEEAREIVRAIPPFCASVLVTHIDKPEEIISLTRFISVNTIQLHSNITISDIQKVKKALPNVSLIKCIHVRDEKSILEAQKYQDFVDAILLDTYNEKTDQVGGTGLTHDWSISKQIIDTLSTKVIVAGGINPDNIEKVKSYLHPYAVDVNSGVKGPDGYKDDEKLKVFIERAHEKEKVLVSACLLGMNCKYDGKHNRNEKVLKYLEDKIAIPICPEQLGGLSTPRIPAERIGDNVFTKKGDNVTEEYQKGAKMALEICKYYHISKAILKSKSPSCGVGKIYDGTFTGTLIEKSGVTAEVLKNAGIEVISSDEIA